ncbi:hypothetical protein PHMEG_00037700, partial [Phytophthora megakarya]
MNILMQGIIEPQGAVYAGCREGDRIWTTVREAETAGSATAKSVEKVDPKATTKPDAKPKPANLPRPPPGPCPKYSELHWLHGCPSVTEDEKVELLRHFRNARKTKRAKLKRLGELLPTTDRTVVLNGVLELPYCPDSGSDFTVIGRSHWDQLLALDPDIQVECLDTPVQNQTFGERKVTATLKAKLQAQIYTAVGPVEPMELVGVLVVDVDDGEFIVDNDLLTTLRVDVDRQLEQLAGRRDDELAGGPIQLDDDDMPVHVDEPLPSHGDRDIFAVVEQLIDRAVDCGFPHEHVERLRRIVHAYDIWRLELRADPPANMPPLEVQLREGARPAKCKPRKYPTHILKVLCDFNDRLVELGLVYEYPRSRWSSPVLPVKKSSELMDLRQTVDYRAVNALTNIMAA